MKKRSAFEKLGDFVLGKGFYIVLFLCVATMGISGYYLIRSVDIAEPVGGNQTVVLPTGEVDGSVQDAEPSVEQAEVQLPAPAAVTTQPEQQPDDPEPVKQPAAEETAAPKAAPVYTWPVKGEILRAYSVETLSLDPTLGDWRTHGGLDIAASAGVEVLAMSAGKVEQVFSDDLMGTTVVIDHGDGLTITYSNLAGRPAVQAGDEVETGTVIGTVGSTAIGESGLGAHLHLEASLEGEPVDPTDYLPERP